MTAGLIDAGLVDEMPFIIDPLLAGPGTALFQRLERHHMLRMQEIRP